MTGVGRSRVLAYGVVPALALVLAVTAGFFTFANQSAHEVDIARIQSVQTATASTVAILSYTPDEVERQVDEVRRLLTGAFRDRYTSLMNDEVIPVAKQQQISGMATVLSAGSVSADPARAEVLVFVRQSVRVGQAPPRSSTSGVEVTLDKVGGSWLISDFTPQGAARE